MRKMMTTFAAVGLVMAMAAPALADQPVEFEFGVTDTDTDPCTGETMNVDLRFSVKAHEHPKTIVWVIDSYGVTSNGYVGNGHETQVTNQNKWVSVFNWVTVNEETGARILIKGRFLVDLGTGEYQHAGVELTCVGRAS